jgi:type III secretion system FlhB-like substrate exporter
MQEDASFKEQELKKQHDLLELRNIIAKSLSKGAKTDQELKQEIPDAKYEEILEVLRKMLSLKLIKKEGFPVKYSLSDEIVKTLEKRKEMSENDLNKIRTSIIIESKANDKATLREAMEKILKSLKEDQVYVVYDATLADIVVHDDLFSTYISAEVSCPDLFNLFRLIYYYGVTEIDIIKPEKLTVPISDLQHSLATITDMVHGYTNIIYDLKRKNELLTKK